VRFGPVPVAESAGLITAHSLRSGGETLRKGSIITPAMAATLEADGVCEVVAVSLETGDVGEDAAAGRLAAILSGENLRVEEPFTGRCNLFATTRGILLIDRGRIDSVNGVDEAVTVATLPAFKPVTEGEMVATVKIIPYAVGSATLARACAEGEAGAIAVAPYRRRRVGVVSTRLASLKDATIDKTLRVLAERLAPTGAEIIAETRVPHTAEGVASGLAEVIDAAGADLTVVFGASAVIDENDVVPAAIRAAGGLVEHLGMPVDPGNLLLLGRIGERIVLGAPGCARSSRENGFDWILNRILADLQVTREELTRLGVGGLLMEIASRPHPREGVDAEDHTSRVDVVVLAAGRSSRMEGPNKLLATFEGTPLVRRSVMTALGSRAGRVHVVTGHMRAQIEAALAGLDVAFVENDAFADGLSTSLAAGFDAASGEADGVLVMLADQPLLTPADLDSLIDAFRAAGEGSIVLAADEGRRANPVILASSFRPEIAALEGDVGARGIVQAHLDLVRAVELGAAASFDVDTPELMERAGGILR